MFLISEQQSEEVNLITEKNASGGKDTFIEGVFLRREGGALRDAGGRVRSSIRTRGAASSRSNLLNVHWHFTLPFGHYQGFAAGAQQRQR